MKKEQRRVFLTVMIIGGITITVGIINILYVLFFR
ncbi:hypothetical protein JOE23_003201 [Amphibacillus cookii]|nr:hypothetical protein [Amphibacillus cookii]